MWGQNLWLKLTHVFSLVVESPSAAVGKGGDNQTDRFHAENQLMVQIVKHNRLRSNFLDHYRCLIDWHLRGVTLTIMRILVRLIATRRAQIKVRAPEKRQKQRRASAFGKL